MVTIRYCFTSQFTMNIRKKSEELKKTLSLKAKVTEFYRNYCFEIAMGTNFNTF